MRVFFSTIQKPNEMDHFENDGSMLNYLKCVFHTFHIFKNHHSKCNTIQCHQHFVRRSNFIKKYRFIQRSYWHELTSLDRSHKKTIPKLNNWTIVVKYIWVSWVEVEVDSIIFLPIWKCAQNLSTLLKLSTLTTSVLTFRPSTKHT